MCMVLIQCFGCADLAKRRAALNGHIHVPFDAQLALVVECVATALDELGFARGAALIAQLHVPLDAQLALVVNLLYHFWIKLIPSESAGQEFRLGRLILHQCSNIGWIGTNPYF